MFSLFDDLKQEENRLQEQLTLSVTLRLDNLDDEEIAWRLKIIHSLQYGFASHALANLYAFIRMTERENLLKSEAPHQPSPEMIELDALRQFKKMVDIGFTAAILSMQEGFGGKKLQCHEAITGIQVAFRQAEKQYMDKFGAAKLRKDGQPEPSKEKL